MVSAQIPGKYSLYRVLPSGSKIHIITKSASAFGPSGSSEGKIASTPEKWLKLAPMVGPKALQVGDALLVTITPVGAGTTDASDSQFAIPITRSGGNEDSIGSPDSATEWDQFVLGDVALIAGREYPVCQKTVRQAFIIGSNNTPAFMSIEDNA